MARKKPQTSGRRPLGRKTVKSSSRQRAAAAGKADNVIAGRRKQTKPTVIDPDAPDEVFGVLLSERRRMGESNPSVPPAKTKNTGSIEPKRAPAIDVTKKRKKT